MKAVGSHLLLQRHNILLYMQCLLLHRYYNLLQGAGEAVAQAPRSRAWTPQSVAHAPHCSERPLGGQQLEDFNPSRRKHMRQKIHMKTDMREHWPKGTENGKTLNSVCVCVKLDVKTIKKA